jgi:hypothetical protein
VIYVRLMGGLGNQMFQYALGRTMSVKNDRKLILDLSHLENQPEGEVPRDYELDCFDIQAKLIHGPAEQHRSILFKNTNPTVVNELSFKFDPAIFNFKDNVLLIGYWQSEKYFKSAEKEIRHDFTFIKPLSKLKQSVYEEIKSKANPVSLQVRRGDYANHPSSMKFHGLMPLSYFNKAADVIVKKINDAHFFVISDDPDWCKKNLKLKYPVTYVGHIPNTGQEDMRLMSLCKHHIIANSSFGWWGAWLNPDKKKIVIAPKKWFLGSPSDLGDRLPKDWMKI